MTRINVVPPSRLSRQHLVAEYRELPRVFALAAAALARGMPPIPARYSMGRGHVTFFYDKLGYLAERQRALVAEMLRRGYSPSHTDPSGLLSSAPAELRGAWEPDAAAVEANVERLRLRDPLHYA